MKANFIWQCLLISSLSACSKLTKANDVAVAPLLQAVAAIKGNLSYLGNASGCRADEFSSENVRLLRLMSDATYEVDSYKTVAEDELIRHIYSLSFESVYEMAGVSVLTRDGICESYSVSWIAR